MKIRLQKFLADAGIASRRKAETYILEGLVKVNGKVIKELGTKIDPQKDRVTYKGNQVKVHSKSLYLLVNKPVGYITSVTDPRQRKTVIDLIPIKERIFPVGRLDYQTSGLLLMTNDGDLTYRLTHPKHHISKTYHVRVLGHPSKEQIELLRNGVDLGIYRTSKAKIKRRSKDKKTTCYEVILFEGKNRQIRRMFDFIKHPVVALERVAIGKLTLGELKTGEYRPLTQDEIRYLKNL